MGWRFRKRLPHKHASVLRFKGAAEQRSFNWRLKTPQIGKKIDKFQFDFYTTYFYREITSIAREREREVMATSVSSVLCAISVSRCSSLNTGKLRTLPSFNSKSLLIHNPLLCFTSSCRCHDSSISRKFSNIKAAILQDNKEKVIVEESFQPNTFPDNEQEGSSGDQLEKPSSSALEKWVVKFEQSVNIFLTDSVIKILDAFYRDRNYARFFVLETIARVPYFAFMSVLHLYETIGWWRQADYLKVHFAESWNEMHHLLIMEELGGNSWWFDRFLSQHMAVFYYFMTVFMYMLSPRMAYHFSECVEKHAFETYDKFIKNHGDELKKLPAAAVAVKYYTEGDLYLFDEFQTARVPHSRRPKIENLYDVFLNVRDDEAEHCKTMKACQTPGSLRSPHSNLEYALEEDSGHVLPQADSEGIVDCIKKSVTSDAREG